MPVDLQNAEPSGMAGLRHLAARFGEDPAPATVVMKLLDVRVESAADRIRVTGYIQGAELQPYLDILASSKISYPAQPMHSCPRCSCRVWSEANHSKSFHRFQLNLPTASHAL